MPTYQELLMSPLWKEKRKQILQRDYSICQKCYNEKLIEGHLVTIAHHPKIHDQRIVYTLTKEGGGDCALFIPYDKDFKLDDLFVYYFVKNDKNVLIAARKANPIDRFILMYEKYKYEKSEYLDAIVIMLKSDYKLTDKEIAPVLTGLLPVDNFIDHDWLFVNGLHVHHKYYQNDRLPWQYPDTALVTYCWVCHEEHHKNTKIQHLDKNRVPIGFLTPCQRCYGAGYFPEYKHVEEGICFHCHGAKYEELIEPECEG